MSQFSLCDSAPPIKEEDLSMGFSTRKAAFSPQWDAVTERVNAGLRMVVEVGETTRGALSLPFILKDN